MPPITFAEQEIADLREFFRQNPEDHVALREICEALETRPVSERGLLYEIKRHLGEDAAHPLDPRQVAAAGTAIASLRKELLDLSRRNRLIHFNQSSSRGARFVRVVDGDFYGSFRFFQPDETGNLADHVELLPLPSPPEEPSDESQPEFQAALQNARLQDRKYLKALEQIESSEEDDSDVRERQAERELRDRLRTELGFTARGGGSNATEEFARSSGINLSFDLGLRNELARSEWRTGLDFDALKRRLEAISKDDRSMREEYGVETLYLVFGCLEWSRETTGGRRETSFSPLILQPVSLVRRDEQPGPLALPENAQLSSRTRHTNFRLKREADQKPEVNLCLSELLRQDFQIEMPEWDSDAPDLQEFYDKVRFKIQNQNGWRLRPFVSLAQLKYSRLPMWLDLDPDAQDKASPAQHPVLARLFGGDELSPVGDTGQEEERDDRLPGHDTLPLVLDSDSSQYAAIREALSGRNLVIQGPPGTGKSQTIANLIAAAMGEGKSVLFVAEKQVALQVVQRRLDEAGLGAFLLELHSAKADRKSVLESIRTRLDFTPSSLDSQQFERAREKHGDLAGQLQKNAEKLSQLYHRSGWTIQQILGLCGRDSLLAPLPDSLATFRLADAPSWDAAQRAERAGLLSRHAALAAERESQSESRDHPWEWVEGEDLHVEEMEALLRAARALNTQLADLAEALDGISKFTDLTSGSFHDIAATVARLQKVGVRPEITPTGLWVLARDPDLKVHAERLWKAINAHSILRQSLEHEAPGLLRDLQAAPALLDCYLADWRRPVRPGLERSSLLPSEHLKSVTGIRELCGKLLNELTLFARLPGWQWLPVTLMGATSVERFAKLAIDCPQELVGRRHRLGEPEARETLGDAVEIARKLVRERTELAEILRADWGAVDAAELNDAIRMTMERAEKWVLPRLFSPGSALAKRLAGHLDPAQIVPSLQRLARYKKAVAELSTHDAIDISGGLFRGIDSNFELLTRATQWCARVIAETPSLSEENSRIREHLLVMGETERHLAGLPATAQIGETALALGRLLPSHSASLDEWHGALGEEEVIALGMIQRQRIWNSPGELDTGRIEELARRCRDVLQLEAYLETEKSTAPVLMPESPELRARIDTLAVVHATVREALGEAWLTRLFAEESGELWSELVASVARLASSLLLSEQAAQEVLRWSVPDPGRTWEEWRDLPAADLAGRLLCASASERTLETQANYNASGVRLKAADLAGFFQVWRSGWPAGHRPDVAQVFSRVVLRSLSQGILTSDPVLSRFRQESPGELRHEFAVLDRKMKVLNQRRLAHMLSDRGRRAPVGNGFGSPRDYTEMSLLRHVAPQTRPRTTVRQLLLRAGRALQVIKPCFLMSPLSVAQFVQRGQLNFDLVIFDEASQVLPADALCALLRADQFVVVGDQMQLPPTTFGARSGAEDYGSEDEPDESETPVAESILEIAATRYPRSPMLRWHYRSRHPSLIAFSNREFYHGNLTVFPSPSQGSESDGVRYIAAEGRYSARLNPIEARRCAEVAIEQMRQFPDRSIGIVALNQPQRELIEQELERLVEEDEAARNYAGKWSESSEPAFVKNLENVQGDERDTIIISTVFGPDQETGTVFQRFGPINSKAGHRRLNVLFTRAKHSIIVVSSLRPEDVHVTERSHRGVSALKAYLEFARSGRLAIPGVTTPGASTESPLEDAVRDALTREGYQCVPQVGVAGFFIDLAVCSRTDPQRFIVGVECDGASYHSSKSARDRDRLRQEILERHGWKICRIWSTDWYRNSRREIDRVLDFIRSVEAADSERAS